jgi:inositol transporter-like SP family MFS transporter
MALIGIGSKKTSGWKATISVAMANYIEAGSIIAGASGLSLWTDYLRLDNIMVGILGAFSANAFGAAFGALLGGWLCDKYGRKFIYTYDLVVYMLGVLVIACSFSFPMLLAGFMITGVAVGAGVPASWTYIAEEAPHARRAAHVGAAQLAWSIGPVVTFVLAVLLAPMGLAGNRIIFLHLFVIAFVTWYIRQGLSESGLWKKDKAREQAGQARGVKTRHPYIELFANRRNWRPLALLLGIYFFWNLVAGAMGFFMPYVYETVGHLTQRQANLLQAALWFCTVAATWGGFMMLGDRMSRRVLYGIGAAMGLVAWTLLTFVGMGWAMLGVFVVLWGLSAGIGAQAFYGLWASELFPTRYRASAQGAMFFIVRAGIGVWSFVFPTVLARLSFKVAGITMLVFLAIALVIGIALAPETRGKTLEQIEEERYGKPKS